MSASRDTAADSAQVVRQSVSRASRRPERDRVNFERLLSSGPLFQPERLARTTTRASSAEPIKAQAVSAISPVVRKQPGWVFVASQDNEHDLQRVAVAERNLPHRRDADAIELFSADFGLKENETLRYCAFTGDAYAALAHARKLLMPFEVSDRRYQCPCAAAAAAIETSPANIEIRRTNFGSQMHMVHPESKASLLPISEVPGKHSHGIRDRETRHTELADILFSAHDCLNLASDLLDDTDRTRQLITGNLFAGAPGVNANTSLERWRNRESPVVTLSLPKVPRQARRSMESWVMRREAIQFLKRRKVDLIWGLLLALIGGAAASAAGIGLLFERTSNLQIAAWAIAGAVIFGGLRCLMFYRRYRDSIAVWKSVLGSS